LKVDDEIELALSEAGPYHDIDSREKYTPICAEIVNKHIPKIENSHTVVDEVFLKTFGCLIIENFLSQDEVNEIVEITKNLQGYNAHVPSQSDKVLRSYDDNYPYNVISYSPENFYTNDLIVDKMRDPKIISLAQSYFGCFPTIYSLNCWKHKFTGSVYGTQLDHRDFDDYKFLSFFIYLSDIDENNGPHVYYLQTHNGEEPKYEKCIIGKAGTAVLADTFAYHKCKPLVSGERLMIWWRYGIHLNKMHFKDGNDNFRVDKNKLFSSIEDNLHNQFLFRAFIK
jgi:hypothetical protein